MIGSEQVRVLIGVTTGPVEVTGLVAIEEAIAQSMACLDRTTQQISISRGYDAFVKAGSGVVQTLYGHGRFRLDVSAPIDVGESWQAGVLLAHALADRSRLAGRDGEAGVIAWATGTVHIDDLSVGKVGAVEEKLRSSLAALRQARESGLEVVAFLPAANTGDVSPETREALRASGIALTPVEKAADMFGRLGLPTGKLAEAQTALASPTRLRRVLVVALGALAAVALAGALAWTAFEPGRRIEAVLRAGQLAEQAAGRQGDDATYAAKAAWILAGRALDVLDPAKAAGARGGENFDRLLARCTESDSKCLASYAGEQNPWRLNTPDYHYAGWVRGGDPAGLGQLWLDRDTVQGRFIRDGGALKAFGIGSFPLEAGAQMTAIMGDVSVTSEGGHLHPVAFDGVMEAAIPGVQLTAGAAGESTVGQAPADRLLGLTLGKDGSRYAPLFTGRFTSDGRGGGRYLGALLINETTLRAAMTLGQGGDPLDWHVKGGIDLPIRIAVGRATLPDGEVMTGLYFPGDQQAYGSLRWPDGVIYYGQIRNHRANGCGVKVNGQGKVFESGVYLEGQLKDGHMPGDCPGFRGLPTVER